MREDARTRARLVDGIFSGIGLMITQALESNDAIVYIIGRRKETLEKAAGTAVKRGLLSFLFDFLLPLDGHPKLILVHRNVETSGVSKAT